jgi:hypothetical protein
MCICDRESRSLEPSCSVILHRERANKVFRKRSSRLLACFFKFFITAHLPLRWTHAEGHCLQRELYHVDHHLHLIVIIKEPQVTYGFSSQIMSYLLNMLICVGIILLNNLLQYVLFIAMIDLYRTCDSTATLFCNTLVMSMIYPWIKIKLKVLIFITHTTFRIQQLSGNICGFYVCLNMVAFGAQLNCGVSVSAFILLYCQRL